MTLLTEIPYRDVDFVWVSSHWDIHLSGLCRYNGKLCQFSTTQENNPEWDEKRDAEDDDYNISPFITTCAIYSLSLKEKAKWLFKKKKFEWAVGYHWTYPYRNDWNHPKRHFFIRRPKWLYRALFNFHYYGLDFKKWRGKKSIS